jgi:N-acetylgalactosamine-6-sulfatase
MFINFLNKFARFNARRGLLLRFLCCLLFNCLPLYAVLVAAERPNIVLLLADDLGYGDLGCYGCPDIKTPHLDALAKQGVRLTSFYSNGPECTPTRAALLSGRYPQRVGGLECAIGLAGVGRYADAVRLAERHDLGLPPDRSVLARALKDAGYATAICGKWHLGYEPKFLPREHGFDYFFGPLGGGIDYFRHNEPGGDHMLYLNDQKVRREGYMTDLIAEEARGVLRRVKDQPLLLYVPFNAPHSPFQGPDDKPGEPLTADNFNRGTRATYVKMVERMDAMIGTILRTLQETGRADNTLVIFSSDNGGPANSRNDPFSGRKGSTYEGGIRVPCIIRWPGKLPPGRESSQVGITMDLTASIVAAAGISPGGDGPQLDGIDIVDHLHQGKPDSPRTLFWRQQRGELKWRGIRDGDLKLVSKQDGTQRQEWLFDLATDLAEKTDLAASRPADSQRLRDRLVRWEEEVKPTR